MWSDLTLDPSFKVKRGYPNLKVLITRLLLVLEVCNVKPTYRKSWAGNLMIWSDLKTNLVEIMDWDCSDVLRFDLGSLLQGHPNLKVLITHLLLVLEICNVKPTYEKLWAGNVLIWSNLTLDPSFKVKRG